MSVMWWYSDVNTSFGHCCALLSIRVRSVATFCISLYRFGVSPSTVVRVRSLHSTVISRFVAMPVPSRYRDAICMPSFMLNMHTRYPRMGRKSSPYAGVASLSLFCSMLSATPGVHDCPYPLSFSRAWPAHNRRRSALLQTC